MQYALIWDTRASAPMETQSQKENVVPEGKFEIPNMDHCTKTPISGQVNLYMGLACTNGVVAGEVDLEGR